MATSAKKQADIDAYNQMMADLQASKDSYTAKTDDEINQQAASEYQTLYEQKKRSAQQSYDQKALALDQQISGLARTYDKQRQQTQDSYTRAFTDTSNALLKRSMSRSSYGAQTLANLQRQGAEALADVDEAENAAASNLEAQKAQLALQLAATLEGYDNDKAADILARANELKDQEYERGTAAQQYRDKLAQQIYNYQLEYNKNYLSSGSGNKSPTSTPDPTETPEDETEKPKSAADQLNGLFDSLLSRAKATAASVGAVKGLISGLANQKKKTTVGGGKQMGSSGVYDTFD